MAVQADSLKSIVTAIAAMEPDSHRHDRAMTRLFFEPDVEG